MQIMCLLEYFDGLCCWNKTGNQGHIHAFPLSLLSIQAHVRLWLGSEHRDNIHSYKSDKT